MAGRSSLFYAAALAALVIGPPAADIGRADACLATLDPDTVLRGAQSVAVTYGLSEEIGAIAQVTAPEASGLEVSSVDPTTMMVSLDTQAAVVGDWSLTFHGANQQTCAGTLNVKGMNR